MTEAFQIVHQMEYRLPLTARAGIGALILSTGSVSLLALHPVKADTNNLYVQQAVANQPLAHAIPLPSSKSSKTIQLSVNNLRNFDTAFKELTPDGRVTILAEGSPFISELEEKQFGDLVKSLSRESATKDTILSVNFDLALEKIASAFDYEVRETGSETKAVYCLTKRYSNVDDLPDVTSGEALHSMMQIRKATRYFNTTPDPRADNFPAKQLVLSLDSSHFAALKNGISVSKLSNDQQKMIQQWGIQAYLGSAQDTSERAVFFLKGAQREDSVFRWMKSNDLNTVFLGCEGRFLNLPGPKNQYILSHGFYAQFLDGPSVLPLPNGLFVISEITNSKMPITARQKYQNLLSSVSVNGVLQDPTSLEAPENKKKPLDKPTPPYVLSLGDLCKGRNSRADAENKVECDPVLASKTVSLIGGKEAKTEDLVRAAAMIYGLQVKHQTGSRSLLLTTNDMGRLRTIEEVKKAVEDQFPQPWLRLLKGNAKRIEGKLVEQEKAQPGYRPDDRFNKLRQTSIELKSPLLAQRNIYNAAIRRLRILVEPRIAQSPIKQASLPEGNEEEHQLLALLILSNWLMNFDHSVNQPLPRYFTEPDSAYVKGLFSKDGSLNRLLLGYKDPLGTFVPEQTFDLRYFKIN
jgi:hypothetical protein